MTETIFEISEPGRRAFVAPELDVPEKPLDELLPARFRRTEPARLPEVAEPEINRHYNRLSKRNFDLDTGFYPLGSCTMKHNPKLHERVAALPGHARLHPLQDPRRAQGALQLMWELQYALAEVSGLPHVSLQPSAGSHGELAGVLLTRAYHEARGEHRHKVLAPETSHGTNPATVTMGGYETVKVAVDADGNVDLDDLKAKATEDVACLMLTNPSTLGLFETQISEIAKVVHDIGATLYYDGANLNAIMGKSRPGDMGFDIVHFNLHKSFTQPHGGGGPGSGPIAVSDRIEPYLPRPQVVRTRERQRRGPDLRPRLRPAAVHRAPARLPGQLRRLRPLLRVHPVARRRRPPGGLGDRGAERQLPDGAPQGAVRRAPPGGLRPPLHARVRALRRADEEAARHPDRSIWPSGCSTMSYHPPTVYFPLVVDEALMIEPTETETRETLDSFAEAVAAILAEAAEDPEVARTAPHTTPVRRLDEAGAAKRPVIRQPMA